MSSQEISVVRRVELSGATTVTFGCDGCPAREQHQTRALNGLRILHYMHAMQDGGMPAVPYSVKESCETTINGQSVVGLNSDEVTENLDAADDCSGCTDRINTARYNLAHILSRDQIEFNPVAK